MCVRAGTAEPERLYALLVKLDQDFLPPISSMCVLKNYAQKLATMAQVYYLEDNGRDVGECAVYMNQGERGFITSIGVLPEARNGGGGTLLLKSVLSEARCMGFKEIALKVRKENMLALQLYQKCGFKCFATSPDGWIDMVCSL